jgi:hypothetical protein
MNGMAVPSGSTCQRVPIRSDLGRARQPIGDQQPHQHDGGEHRNQDAHADGDGKAANGASADRKQDQHLDQRCRVRVDDRAVGATESGFERRNHAVGLARLLACALVDEDVGVDGHAQRQQDAGDTGKGKRRPEQRQAGERQGQVCDQSDRGKDAEQAVGRDDEPDHKCEAGSDCKEPGFDRVGAQTGPDRAFLDDGQCSRQCAGPQQHGEVIRVLDGEVAADLPLAADYRLANDGRADHLAIEHDGKRLTHVARADIGKALGADAIEPEVDDPFAGARVLTSTGFR